MDTKAAHDHIIPKSISKAQASDTGQAMVLICLIAFFFTDARAWLVAAAALLVVNMTAPRIFTPLGYVWFGLSGLLGTVMSKVLLSIVFFLVVTPIGLLRRAAGRDTLKLRAFKEAEPSAFVVRDKTFVAEDVEQPF